VAATDYAGQVTHSIEMSGDADLDGWRLWQCRNGGASEYARMMTIDGWSASQLNTAMTCNNATPWWNKLEIDSLSSTTPSANDVTIGVQGHLSLEVGTPKKVVYVTELSPGAPPSAWTASAAATPSNLWSPNLAMEPISVDVTDTYGCGVSCEITGVTANQSLSHGGVPNADFQITGDLTVNLRRERTGGATRVYTIRLACEDIFGNVENPTASVTVANPNGNGGGPP
jgi:hypothetical protein